MAGLDDSAEGFEHCDGRQPVLLGRVAGKVTHAGKIRKALLAETESRLGADANEPCDSDAVVSGPKPTADPDI